MIGLAESTLKDLQDAGSLYVRRQIGLGVVRVNFERAATRLRLVAPEHAEVVRSFADLLARIDEKRPEKEQWLEVGRVLDRYEDWLKRSTGADG
jgi:hypothetical protein